MAEIPVIWRDEYRINVYEADALGRVSIPSLCDYCQDAASRHYFAVDAMIGPLLLPSQIWALTRLELEISDLPAWGGTIEVETWSRGIGKASAYREFILRLKNGAEAARGTTSWVVLDRGTMRLARLETMAGRWPSQLGRLALGRDAAKVGELTAPEPGKPFQVRYGDIDVNRHVNSVRYIRWTMDALGGELLESRRVRGIAVNFLDEALPGDEVLTASESISGSEYRCGVIRTKDSKTVCRTGIYF
jgi:acyl-ACP thioesterase